MRTVLIFDQCGAEALEFYVLDGDYRHLAGVYVNSCEGNQKKQDELSDLLYDPDTGEKRKKARHKFPVKAVRAGASVVVCGFIP